MANQKLDMSTYLRNYIPALEWILSCLAHKAREVSEKGLIVVDKRFVIEFLFQFSSDLPKLFVGGQFYVIGYYRGLCADPFEGLFLGDKSQNK